MNTLIVQWFDFSVDTMELFSEGRSSSSPIFIRGLPVYGYLLTFYTPIILYFIARGKVFRLD